MCHRCRAGRPAVLAPPSRKVLRQSSYQLMSSREGCTAICRGYTATSSSRVQRSCGSFENPHTVRRIRAGSGRAKHGGVKSANTYAGSCVCVCVHAQHSQRTLVGSRLRHFPLVHRMSSRSVYRVKRERGRRGGEVSAVRRAMQNAHRRREIGENPKLWRGCGNRGRDRKRERVCVCVVCVCVGVNDNGHAGAAGLCTARRCALCARRGCAGALPRRHGHVKTSPF